MTQKEFGLRFGALADSLEKQIDEQGFMYDGKKDKYDKVKFALLTLYFGDLLTDNELRKKEEKLYKRITREIYPKGDK